MSEYGYDFERKRPDGTEIGSDEDNSSIKSDSIEPTSSSKPAISEQGATVISEEDFSTEGLSALQDNDSSNSSITGLDSFDSSDQKLSSEGLAAIHDEKVSSISFRNPDYSTQIEHQQFSSDSTEFDNSIKQSERITDEKPSSTGINTENTLGSRNSDFADEQFTTELPGRTFQNAIMTGKEGFSSSVEINDKPVAEVPGNNMAEREAEYITPITNASPDIPVYDPKLEKELPKELKENPSGSGIKPTIDSIVVNPNGRSTLNIREDTQHINSGLNLETDLPHFRESSTQNNDVPPSQILINDQKTNNNEIVLENGEKVITTGGVQAFKDLNHQQGEVEGFEGTCGLCSVQCVSNQFGLTNEKGEQISEKDVVTLAKNEHPPLCVTDSNPENNGGTSQVGQQILLEKLGIPAHIESGKNMDQLAQEVEQGKGVIAGMEATELWGDNPHKGINLLPRPNHAVTVIDTARDPGTNKLKGFFVNDSGNNYANIGSGRFVSLGEMHFCWQNHGGSYVVTNHSFLNRGANKWS